MAISTSVTSIGTGGSAADDRLRTGLAEVVFFFADLAPVAATVFDAALGAGLVFLAVFMVLLMGV